MLKTVRVTAAIIFFTIISLLFLDFTGTLHQWFGWLAKIQLVPAILSVNVIVIVLLLILTLLFGRIYCSVICPLGVMQDIFTWFGGKAKKNRFSFSPAISWLRYLMLAIFIICLVAGVHFIVSILEPYSAYGRIASNLMSPIYDWGNNLFAYLAERYNSYAFYSVDVWIKNWIVLSVAIVTIGLLFVLAFLNGRSYCNTICPVGTFLGLISKFSLFRPTIDTTQCNGCGLCARNCKCSCIDNKKHVIDYSRCVVCMDCIGKCKRNAIKYKLRIDSGKKAKNDEGKPEIIDKGKRVFLSSSAIIAVSTIISAQEKKVDGGLAIIKDKKARENVTKITPPGSPSIKHLAQHCTACQLCINSCPNDVLHPSTELETFMQPIMKFDKGYCRPECNECSSVCPTGAIRPITIEDKSAEQIGHAVWVAEMCIANTEGVSCGNCGRHCTTGAIHMVPPKEAKSEEILIPAIDTEKCIGCGACENLCPVSPLSAIYVTGHERHRKI
ncbi:4Fe-4S binding protein [Phocaeicola paurosaccharolyticus]|uniref:4Fe-4S binding protein n=1 Tax=Phocaeicola paurosaccharolyticus TaxID=732242 RepID=UPI000468174D|nr:4Fe-4S binding protein [Phocaeicola paurosaccharolyticus]